MSMDRFYRYNRGFLRFPEMQQSTQFREIPKCFVRKDHSCGKFLGASKSCFVACPSEEEVETILALIIEKLTKIGIEPVIAIKERAYGQDIFCTKICGKIIESQFCLVILDDTMELINGRKVNIPNPNVYYEYGLMTALGKYVIPLQKEGQELAFNIQTHDTIKYTPRNISAELDKALKDAAKITEEDRAGYQREELISLRLFIRSIEINGYQKKDYNWFLDDDINDTVFTGFGHPERREYLFFSLADTRELLRSCLTDMQVIIKRLESKYNELLEEIDSYSIEIEKLSKELQELEEIPKAKAKIEDMRVRSQFYHAKSSLEDTTKKREDRSSKAELIRNSKFAITFTPELMELKVKVLEQYDNMHKDVLPLPLYIGDTSGIQIGDLNISFESPTL
ncbi:MAG: TMF family protein [Chloroflexi bacterium]|nr:TMF family protein [Chloroflexota bacterium]